MSYNALAYYSSATDDEVGGYGYEVLKSEAVCLYFLAMDENRRAFSRLFFLPRVMRSVSKIDTATTLLGYPSRLPVFVSGAALAKLGHPLGEVNITRGCGRSNIIQMVSSNSSCSFEELAKSRVSPGQPLFFQLYKNKDDEVAKARIKHVEELGYKAIFLTVDAVVMSNRERDIKAKPAEEDEEPIAKHTKDVSKTDDVMGTGDLSEEEYDVSGTSGAMIANDDRNMTWEKVGDRDMLCFFPYRIIFQTIPWLRSVTKLPIVIKGAISYPHIFLATYLALLGIQSVEASHISWQPSI